MTAVTDTINWGTQQADTVVTVYFVPNGESRTYDSFEDDVTSEGFNAYEKAQFQAAFDRIASVSGLTFEIVTGTAAGANADFQMVLDTNEISNLPSDDQFLGYFNPPGEAYAGVGVFNGAFWDREEYTFTPVSLPEGLSIDGTSGLISGQPAKSGTFDVKFKLVNQFDATGEVSYRLTVSGE